MLGLLEHTGHRRRSLSHRFPAPSSRPHGSCCPPSPPANTRPPAHRASLTRCSGVRPCCPPQRVIMKTEGGGLKTNLRLPVSVTFSIRRSVLMPQSSLRSFAAASARLTYVV